MPATVDVLIPVYNGEEFLRQAVHSIQAQNERDIRIIIIDDGSKDQTPAILKDISANDPRIEVITKVNGGIVDALNAGLAVCNADFVARHDADDIAYPNRFDVQLKYLREHPDYAAVGCCVRHIDEHGQPTGTIGRGAPPEDADPHFAPAREPYIIHPFLIARRAPLISVGGYRYVHHAEDADLYWRLQEINQLHNLSDILGEYRVHSSSVSGASIRNARVQALSAQLSAISAVRRRSGQPDLNFSKGDIKGHEEASGSLAKLLKQAGGSLTEEERQYLDLATSAKLLELASYRPYEVSLQDCVYMRSVSQQQMKKLPKMNRALLNRYFSGAAARLARSGKWSEARALIWPALWPAAMWRLMLRVCLPHRSRIWLKTLLMPTRVTIK